MLNVRESSMRSRYPYPPERESVSGELTTVERVDSAVHVFVQTRNCYLVLTVREHQKVHRDNEDTCIGRILRMRNVINPLRSGESQ